jgi:hypothetical protein
MALCALVWWFSYDHGRGSFRARVARLEAENLSLREKAALLERDVEILGGQLAEARAALGPADPAAASALGELPPVPAAPREAAEGSRLTLKLAENKGLLGGRVVLTMVELDSLDQEALVRAHFSETGRRLARLMVPGDIFELELDGEVHRLYLDQIRGTLAFFLVDALPKGD